MRRLASSCLALVFLFATPAWAADAAPVITGQPSNQTVSLGATLTLTVAVTGSPAPTYQWQRLGAVSLTWSNVSDGTIYSGANTPTLTIAGAPAELNNNRFRVQVSNTAGAVTSSIAFLNVAVPPNRISPTRGQPLTLAVTATSSNLPLTYQWRKDNRPIPGATAASFTIASYSNNDAGAYTLVVTDALGDKRYATSFLLPQYGTTKLKLWGGAYAGQATFPADSDRYVGLTTALYTPLALRYDGSITVWGDVGGAYPLSSIPDTAYNVVAVRAAGSNAVALCGDGTVVAWGDPSFNKTAVPAGLNSVVGISVGSMHTLALRADGTVVSWGYNDAGQTTVPASLADVVQVAAGNKHSLALKFDGTVVAWGANESGQANVPAGLTDVIEIAAGGATSFALKSDGSIVAWGLADWSNQTTVPPEAMPAAHIAAGLNHAVAIKADGTLVSWGANTYGQQNLPAGLGSVAQAVVASDFTLALCDASAEEPSFTLTDLGVLDGIGVTANAINPSGVITGTLTLSSYDSRIFRYADGVMSDLGNMGASPAGASAINHLGEIAGNSYSNTAAGARGVMWKNGQFTDLVGLGESTFATGISANSTVIGMSGLGFDVRPFSYRNGVVTDLTPALGVPASVQDLGFFGSPLVGAASFSGEIHAYRYDTARGLTDLGTLPGDNISHAIAINPRDAIVGWSQTGPATRGFRWENGLMISLGSLGGTSTYPYAINDEGVIVGTAKAGDGSDHAFMFRDGVMIDLHPYLAALAQGGDTFTTSVATDINYAGQIVGYANNGRSFLLTPVPASAPLAPAITLQPDSWTLKPSSATAIILQAAANGSRPFTYQWEKSDDDGASWTNASGGTSDQLSVAISPVASPTTSLYRCCISNASGSATSQPSSVRQLPVASTEGVLRYSGNLTDVTVAAGGRTAIGFRAQGYGTVAYRWQSSPNGTDNWSDLTEGASYEGTTTQRLAIVAQTELHGLFYRCHATNAAGEFFSRPAQLTVVTGAAFPTFTQQPGATSVFAGSPATFTATASGSGSLRYSWQAKAPGDSWKYVVNSSSASGTNTGTLTLAAPASNETGTAYRCLVYDANGSVISVPALLTVQAAPAMPVISTPPANGSGFAGQQASFTVAATAATAPTFQWQRLAAGSNTWSDLGEGGAYSGTTGATLTVTGLAVAMRGDQFRAVVTTAAGSTTSSAATLNVTETPGLLWVPGSRATETGFRLKPVAITGGVQSVTAGSNFTFFLRTDGTLWATGTNVAGQLGVGDTIDRSTPVQVATDVASVYVASYKGFFLKNDGSLWGMGQNSSDSLGYSNTNGVPQVTPLQLGNNVKAVAASSSHTLFLKHDGTVWAAGSNNFGQLGLDPAAITKVRPFIQIATGVASIAVQDEASFLTKTDGTLWVAGRNTYGRLGTGNTTNVSAFVQVATQVASIAPSSSHTLFLKTDGSLWAVGRNDLGQLADSTTTDRFTPVQVATGVTQVRATGSATFYLKTDHTLWGVGSNTQGRLGDGTTTNRSTPFQIATDVAGVEASWLNTYFRKLDGSLWGVGDNVAGQLGDGTTTTRTTPQQIAASTSSFSAGSLSVLYLNPDHELFGVGLSANGELGDGTIFSDWVLREPDVVSAETGTGSIWYVKADGTLWSVFGGHVPGISEATGVSQVTDVSVDDNDGWPVYRKADGTVQQLDVGNVSTLIANDVAQVYSGSNYRLFLKNDGSLWGLNSIPPTGFTPVFGNGTQAALVATDVKSVSTASNYFLFVKGDHSLWGQGTVYAPSSWPGGAQSASTPLQLETDVLSASAHNGSTACLKTDGRLWINSAGRGPSTGSPLLVAEDIAAGEAGYGFVHYIKNDGTLFSRSYQSGALGTAALIAPGVSRVNAGTFEGYIFIQSPGGTPPTIETDPISATADHGTAVLLTVTATGPGPLDYQWYKDGVAVARERHASLRIPYLTAADAGSYTVTVTNRGGSVTSGAAAVALDNIPATFALSSATFTYNGSLQGPTITATPEAATFTASGTLTAINAGSYTATASATGNYTGSNNSLTWSITKATAGVTLGGLSAAYDTTAHSAWGSPQGVVTTFSGTAGSPGSLDGTGSSALFHAPRDTAMDSARNIYVADSSNSTIRKITPAGVVTTFAGTALQYGVTDATGSAARFLLPTGVAVDSADNLYVADSGNHIIRKITPAGVVTTFAGLAGSQGSADGTGAAARFKQPGGLAVDGAGNVYVADTYNHTIRKITPAGAVTTLAGLAGSHGSTDDTGSAARFYNPFGLCVDGAGNVYVADTSNYVIRKITPAGAVTTLAGTALSAGATDATGSAARFYSPYGVEVDAAGNVYVTDNLCVIRKITPAGAVTTLAGDANASHGSADGTGAAARFWGPGGLTVDPDGNLYVADTGNNEVRKVTAGGVVTTFAGTIPTRGSADGTGAAARYDNPRDVAVDGEGNVYVADGGNRTIRKITPAGVVTTLAGAPGVFGSADGTGSAAQFGTPTGVAVDHDGNVYVSDQTNQTIRKITPGGDVTTLAGAPGVSGSADGTGSAARFYQPSGVAVDSAGNVYVADYYNYTIRKIAPGGVVTTFAGSAGLGSPVDGTGANARFYFPSDVAVDSSDNVYVADGNLVRKITPGGVVTTLAGHPNLLGSADGRGSAARFASATGLTVDGSGNVYVADSGNDTIRKITPDGLVTTVAGTAGLAASTDGTGSAARFYWPSGVAVDGAGNLYVADTINNIIRKITATSGTITLTYDGASTAPTNVGSYSVVATLTDSNYQGSASGTLVISQGAQAAVAINSAMAVNFGAPYTATATGGSGTGAIVWSLGTGSTAPNPAINASTGVVTSTGVGTVMIKAYRAADASYLASATTADFTLTIFPGFPVITWPAPDDITYGTALNATQHNASANVAGTFTYSPAGGTILDAGTHTLSITFHPTDNINYGSTYITRTLTVNPAPTTFALGATSFTYTGAAQSPAVITAPSGATFTTGGTLSAIAPGNYTATATATGNYSGANNSLTWTINKAGQSAPVISSPSATILGIPYTATADMGSGTVEWALGAGSTSAGAAIDPVTGALSASSTGSVVIKARFSGDQNRLASAYCADFPVTVAPALGVVAMSAGGRHTVFIQSDGSLWGMGDNGNGQLGDGTVIERRHPVRIATGVVAASAGGSHTLFIKADGSLWGVGNNNQGNLGDGTHVERHMSIKIADNVAAVSAGNGHSLFLKQDGTLWGMGQNLGGLLGQGAATANQETPVQIATGVLALSAGDMFSAFVKNDHSLWMMGANHSGQLGDGTLENKLVPTLIATDVASVSAGSSHTAFIKTDRSLWSMGTLYAIPTGVSANVLTPVQVDTNVSFASADNIISLYLKPDQALWGTGTNVYGAFGDGSAPINAGAQLPHQVGSGIADVSVGGNYFSLFLKADGTLQGAGLSVHGELGTEINTHYNSAITITGGPLAAPGAPGPVTITAGSPVQVARLAWNHVLGARRYEVWRSGTNSSATAMRVAADLTANFFEDSTVENGVYYYWIKSIGLASDSGFSAPATVTFTNGPEINSHPSDVSTSAGQTAGFTVTATSASPLSHQWQIRQSGEGAWSNLTNNGQYSGVLTGTLQVTDVAPAQDSGDQFRCVVTNAAGTATSNAATLTVENPASVPGDIDGDGISEVVWRYTPSGLIATWTSSSGYLVLGTEDANWKAVGSGDFDGDGRTDMLWRYGPAGLIASWTSTAGYLTLGTEDANWKIVTTGDFDADGQSDVLWRYVPTGRIASWTSSAGYLNLGTEDANWQAISAGDFDSDGYADVLWRHVPTGSIVTWTSGGSYLSIGTEDTNWRYLATGDYDGDGTTDVLWRYVPTGLISSWTSSAGYRALGSEGSGWIAVGN